MMMKKYVKIEQCYEILAMIGYDADEGKRLNTSILTLDDEKVSSVSLRVFKS